MTEGRAQWEFDADEAASAAQVVADHDPEEVRTQDLVPRDRAAATASIRELRKHLDSLPKFAQHAMRGATSSAGQLSDDRFQGIAELIQNADDLGATDTYFALDEIEGRLLFAHNGSGLTLHDVLALAVPWLSLKVANADQLGRYGIGLSTLQSLSDTLEVHEGHFHLRLQAQALTFLEEELIWPGGVPIGNGTVFVVPFEAGVATSDDLKDWLKAWDEAGLVFLSHLERVILLDADGNTSMRLALTRSESDQLVSERGTFSRRLVTAAPDRSWLVYTRHAPAPPDQTRARKAKNSTTPVSIAFPRFGGDPGHIHVGLPVRAIGLPFRIMAQFDPITNRRDLNQTAWTLALIPLVAHLWIDATLDLFRLDAAAGWEAIPLASEFEADALTVGNIREVFTDSLMVSARKEFANAVRLDGGQGEHLNLAELAFEVPELEHLLEPEDTKDLARSAGVITASARSGDGQWRAVLTDFVNLGVQLGPVVSVRDALPLFSSEDRLPKFVVELLGVVIKNGLAHELWHRPCLIAKDGRRLAPSDLGELDVLLSEDPSELWSVLGVGLRLHPDHIGVPLEEVITEWLREEGLIASGIDDAAALRTIAAAGEAGEKLPDPLTDSQASALRSAMEALASETQSRLGAGIGRAVKLAAIMYDGNGNAVSTHAAPADAYIIERDANSWHVAAGKTPGMLWLHRRYHDTLRSPTGRDGLGAQKLFRVLGAETAPRLIAHPLSEERYLGRIEGVPRSIPSSPQRRNDLLLKHHATYTVGDYASPHLDKVLASIASDKDKARRRKRATAVLASLTRAWPRLEQKSTVMAASTDYGWIDKGRVEAWWVSSAASVRWLTSENGKPASPATLRIKTPSTEALYGDDPDRYLASTYTVSSFTDVLVMLGVAQDAGVHELIEKLEHIRDSGPRDPRAAADVAAPVYKALAAQITSSGSRRFLGALPQDSVIRAFRGGVGLVATNVGWRSPTVVFTGPQVFGDRYPFVPAINGAESLWSLLRIHSPGVDDAKAVLRNLSSIEHLEADDRLVMLECLRILAHTRPTQLGILRRSPVWVGDRWAKKRPIYAVANPLIADALKDRLPIWAPGGALEKLDSLIDPLGLTRVDHRNSRVLDSTASTEDPDLTKVFSRAVANLRADLALSDPAAEASLNLAWDELAQFQVSLLPRIRLALDSATIDKSLTLDVEAWLESESGTLYVTDIDAAARLTAGAHAVAAAFSGDVRSISHAWVVAWSEALAGHQAEKIATAASEDAQRRREREEADDAKLREFASRTKAKRSAPKKKAGPGATSTGIPDTRSNTEPPLPARNLIDTSHLTIVGGDGVVINAEGTSEGSAKRKKPKDRLKDPNLKSPKAASNPRRRAQANYSDLEKETAGMEVVRQVLGLDIQEMIDIRNQHNVGADAVDDLRNYYELKVHNGDIPDQIRLQDSEIQRAYETEDFFLIAVGHVEDDGEPVEVRIITDPVGKLQPTVAGHATFSGVLKAKSFQYFLEPNQPDGDESPEPDADAS